ncbi:hypothetical protein [Staphylococcus canis]|uniref:Uncharacterized protein n=1 Tax=Staphylococcus canis TaxID=2724942 RepID=A0ABS0TE34_9STAP|nr:hypothetical protein [Staphylococcus canis]MBI5976003.1 hypothetical protein [Staphylococcus canis]
MIEKLLNWLIPVFVFIIILAAQYFISYYKDKNWSFFNSSTIFINFSNITFIENNIIWQFYYILNSWDVFLLEQGYRGQKNRNKDD